MDDNLALDCLSTVKKENVLCPECAGLGERDNGMYFNFCECCVGRGALVKTTAILYENLTAKHTKETQ